MSKRRLSLAAIIAATSLVSSTVALAQSSLLDDLRRELDPDATQPIVLRTDGKFTATARSLYGGDPDPFVSDSIGGEIFSTGAIRFGKIQRVCKILGGCLDFDIESSEPGVDIDVVSYFGAEFTVQLSGHSELQYQATLTGGQFNADLPLSVAVRLPAQQTVAPGQSFIVESSWRIDRTDQDFRYNYDTTAPGAFVETDLDFGMDLFFEAVICVFGCTEFDITITLPPINWPMIDFGLPYNLCALADEVKAGFCPLASPCDLFPSGECPSIFLDDDPYDHEPIPGLESIAPGAATVDILREAKGWVTEGLPEISTSAFYGTSSTGRTITSEWGGVGIVGLTLDWAQVAAALIPGLPPLNASLTDLLAWKNPAAELSVVVEQATDAVEYNIFDASLGVDVVLGQSFAMRARPPRIQVFLGANPGPADTPIATFRAGDSRELTMPDTVAPGTSCNGSVGAVDCFTFRLVQTPAAFTTRMPAILDPRFELSAGGLSIDVPLVGKVGLDSVYQSGDLLPAPPLFYDNTFDVSMDPGPGMMPSGFATDLEYDLVPIQDPNVINGRDLATIDGNNGAPRLVGNNNEEINFAEINFGLETGNADPVVVVPPGLRLKNVQVLGGGTFNLIGKDTAFCNGESCQNGTYLAMSGDALQPGFDNMTINFAMDEGSNFDGAGQVNGGLQVATNYGAYIRNGSTLNLGPAPDGTILIAGAAPNYALRSEVPQNTNVRGRLEVFSGCNTDNSAGPRLVELTVADSSVNAHEFILSGLDANCSQPGGGTTSIHSPIDVIVRDSTIFSNVFLEAADTLIEVSGNSFLDGRDDLPPNLNSTNRGVIDVSGRRDDVSGLITASSVFDSGLGLRNLSGGSVVLGGGSVLSVLTGNSVSSSTQDGRIEMLGSYDRDDTTQALATVASLGGSYTAADIFAAFTSAPTEDALLLIDGGIVSDHTILNQGASVLALDGALVDSSMEMENGRFVVSTGGFGGFNLVRTRIGGMGNIGIDSNSTLSLAAGGLGDAQFPMIVAENTLRDQNSNRGEKGKLIVVNDGFLAIAEGPDSEQPAELHGDASVDGFMELRNGGDIYVQNQQELRFRGDVAILQRGTFEVDAGGTVSLVGQQVPATEQDGTPVTLTFAPKFELLEGRTTINGVLNYLLPANNDLEVLGGRLEGNGVIDGNVVLGIGVVGPGFQFIPHGMLTVNGDYTQSPLGRLEINANINGNSFLDVGGTATLSGELGIVLDAAWWATNPIALDASLPIMNHGGSVGEFDSVDVKLSDGTSLDGFTFVVQYDVNSVSIVYEEAADEREVAENVFVEIGRFDDTPAEFFAYSFIERLAASGITSGCAPNLFCPEGLVTRAQMAVFLERGINGAGFVPPPATGTVFNDVGAGDFAAAFIEQLRADGITSGCGGGNYCPNDSVTRAQMAIFLLRSKYGAAYTPPAPTGVFADVPVGSFADRWVEQLAAEGITSGCGNGNYCPNDPVTRAQMAVFLVRTFGL